MNPSSSRRTTTCEESLTEQHEESLRDQEQNRLRAAILEAALDAVVAVDHHGRIVEFNPAAEAMFGYARADVLGRDVGPLLVPERMRGAYARGLARCLETREPRILGRRLTLTAMRVDGTEFPAEVSITQIPIPGPPLFAALIRDITERRRTQEDLRRAEARYHELFSGLPLGLYRTSPSGEIMDANPAFAQMLGYAGINALIGRDARQLYVDPNERARWRALMEREDVVRDFEMQLRRRDGGVIWVKDTARAVHDEREEIVWYEGALEDITDRKGLESQLVQMASRDPLTGLYNRRRFQEELERQLTHARRYASQGALILVDLDHFKDINDRLGHRAGDELLLSVCAVLRRRLRESDLLVRLGGDEFAVLAPADGEGAHALSQDILRVLRNHSCEIRGEALTVTASVGVALFPDHGLVADELLVHADLALYQAKEDGRNRVCLYAPNKEWRAHLESRVVMAGRIREALRQDDLVLLAQPIRDLVSGATAFHELLLRMKDEEGELALPETFLDVAGRFGLMAEIDRWVVARAIRLIAQRSKTGSPLRLSVNISSRAFHDKDLLAMVKAELARAPIPAGALILEITERDAIVDLPRAQQFIRTLKRLGCLFSLDDFGVGFSSFGHLKHLPVDYLKIDGTFIQNLVRDPLDRHLVQAMVQVAWTLGKKTVAEFVSDDESVALLRTYGVDYAQGYHIGRPRPLTEVLVLSFVPPRQKGAPAAARTPGPRAGPASAWRSLPREP